MYTVRDKEPIVNFLRGIGPDFLGRKYHQLVGRDDEQMERCHDQIQWMFPLHESSKFAMVCPIVNEEIVQDAIRYREVNDNLRLATERMTSFLGIGKFHDVEKQQGWLNDKNHNLLRVTRIIRCLRLFELEAIALSFYQAACDAEKNFALDPITLSYWEKALKDYKWNSLR